MGLKDKRIIAGLLLLALLAWRMQKPARVSTVIASESLAESERNYRRLVAQFGGMELVLDRIEIGMDHTTPTALIHVSDLWHVQEADMRQEATMAFWREWQLSLPQDSADKAQLYFADRQGNQVASMGHSWTVNAPVVWVADKR